MFLQMFGLSAQAQIINFKPLERGEFTEEEEKIHILRGLSASGSYSGGMARDKSDALLNSEKETRHWQDFQLKLSTVFHRDTSMVLNLETLPSSLRLNSFREDSESPSNTSDNQPMSLGVREAYLKYNFNPRSALLLGKHEISIGDRRGKVFNGILPGLTYDCRIGTWCMPFGAAKIGPAASDWIYHWALEYTAWEEKKNNLRDTLKVELFRIIYKESNIPLGINGGPGRFNPDAPDCNSSDASCSQAEGQETDSLGNPIYYDTVDQNYFGLRINWESGSFFFNYDIVSNQGDRRLHRYYSDATPLTGDPLDLNGTSEITFQHPISGMAMESEFGFRYPLFRWGMRLLHASGEPPRESGDQLGINGGTKGYYEMVPGSYQGTRLYFNGNGTSPDSGSGLGHSINNIQMYGLFIDFNDPSGKGMGYSGGLYMLKYNHPVRDINGDLQDEIGLEWDNLFTIYLKKAVKLQLEANAIDTKGGFRRNSQAIPQVTNDLFTQGVARLIYTF